MVNKTSTYLDGVRDLCVHMCVLLWVHMHVCAHLCVAYKNKKEKEKQLSESSLTFVDQIMEYWYKGMYHFFFFLF